MLSTAIGTFSFRYYLFVIRRGLPSVDCGKNDGRQKRVG